MTKLSKEFAAVLNGAIDLRNDVVLKPIFSPQDKEIVYHQVSICDGIDDVYIGLYFDDPNKVLKWFEAILAGDVEPYADKRCGFEGYQIKIPPFDGGAYGHNDLLLREEDVEHESSTECQ